MDPGAASLIAIALGAVVTALLTWPPTYPLIAGAIQAVVAVIVYYGVDVSDTTAGNITAAVFAIVGLFVVRENVSPEERAGVSSA